MTTGTIKWFNANKGYGFIASDDGSPDVFLHISAVEQSGLHDMVEGRKISFTKENGRNGKVHAVDLKEPEAA
ncbi:MAG: cold-shock protein [Acetobacter sp.]|nr:cold-shock protein [Acetobacter sp.]